MVLVVTWPQANLYGMFLFPIGRIYTNVSVNVSRVPVFNVVKAIMDTLTVRASLRSEVVGAEEVLDVSRILWKPLCS
jgi:hypothetical protein